MKKPRSVTSATVGKHSFLTVFIFFSLAASQRQANVLPLTSWTAINSINSISCQTCP